MQVDHFGNTHSGRVHCCEHGFIFKILNGIQKTVDLIGSKNCWKFPLHDHAWDQSVIPKDVQDIPVKKWIAEL